MSQTILVSLIPCTCNIYYNHVVISNSIYSVQLYMYIPLEIQETLLCTTTGEKLTDDEVDTLLSGLEDGQGQVAYEGN